MNRSELHSQIREKSLPSRQREDLQAKGEAEAEPFAHSKLCYRTCKLDDSKHDANLGEGKFTHVKI